MLGSSGVDLSNSRLYPSSGESSLPPISFTPIIDVKLFGEYCIFIVSF